MPVSKNGPVTVYLFDVGRFHPRYLSTRIFLHILYTFCTLIFHDFSMAILTKIRDQEILKARLLTFLALFIEKTFTLSKINPEYNFILFRTNSNPSKF